MKESEFKIEWLYSNLRWFYLMAIAAVLGLETTVLDNPEAVFTPTVIALLTTGTIANLLVMILLLRNAFRRPMSSFTLILDISLTLGLIGTTGGVESPLLFVSFIPIITTAVRYNWWASLSLVLGTVLIYIWSTWVQFNLSWEMGLGQIWEAVQLSATKGLILLTAGLAIVYVGTRIRQALTAEQREQEAKARSQVKAAHQRIRLIFELASTLSATLNYERVLQAALDVSQAGLRELVGRSVKQIQIILLFGVDEQLQVANSRGLTRMDKKQQFPAKEGILTQVISEAEMRLINEPGADPELGRLVAMHHCREAFVVPLRAGFESYGVMIVASPEAGLYSNDYQDLLEAICSQAVMALQNAKLYQNLMEEKERLVAVEEDARKKLARDLHDGPTQTISAIAMRLNYVRMLIDKDTKAAVQEIQELEDKARTTAKVIRQMLFTLRPLILESQGLVPALEQYIEKLAETDHQPIHLEAEPKVNESLDEKAQGALFYIIEEAITNARKHAQADDIWIRIYHQGKMNVIAEIEDNGLGFDLNAVEENYHERNSLGIMNLKERAALADGKTTIKSAPGEGTKITVTVPTRPDYDG